MVSLEKAHKKINQERLKRETMKSGIENSLLEIKYMCNAAWLLALFDELGLTPDELKGTMDRIDGLHECINSRHLTVKELQQLVFDELGIDVRNTTTDATLKKQFYIPHKIGDEVWTTRNYNGSMKAVKGKITEICINERREIMLKVFGQGVKKENEVFMAKEEAERGTQNGK